MKSLARRSFLKKSSAAGIASLIGSWTFPEHVYGMAGNNNLLKTTNKPICDIKKEVRVACPQLRLAPMNNMGYIGRGKHLEESLSFMQSSDWSLMSMRRTSEDNGRNWS